MPEWITPRQFHESTGVADWRLLGNGVSAHFRTGSFGAAVDLLEVIGELAAAARDPDVDLRPAGVTVRLLGDEAHGLSRRDAELARDISTAARRLGMAADPGVVQDVQVTVDAVDIPAVRAFWGAVLGYREAGDEDLVDPRAHGPSFWFQRTDAARRERNRLHVDVFVPHDEAEARVAAGVAAGGRVVSDAHAPAWWTLADPEGNEVDVATWQGRD